ncbi:MAG: nucleoside kinase [Lachnospira sp.]|nr:nucleoside kinase [Lachnospira sp.]
MHFAGKKVLGMTIKELVKDAQADYNNRIILVKLNGRLQEIKDQEVSDGTNEFVTTDTAIGNETYRRSVVLLMLNAISKVAGPEVKVAVEYSISKGLYCNVKGDFVVTEEFLSKVKAQMLADVKADLPIVKTLMKTRDAIELFDKCGMADKTKLFKYRRSSYVNVYSLEEYKDYYYGYMAPSTGILGVFDLFKYDKGFVLQLPVKEAPDVVPEFAPPAKLFNVLKESSEWAEMLEMSTVGDLNEHLTNGTMNDLILVQEALQEQKIFEIVQMIQERPGTKFVMIAGPSSSGKTTFSHRLSIQLMAKGYKPHPIAVDDYFVEREQTPLDENGDYNFEDLHAIDIELFNNHMNALLAGEEIEMPKFNFKTGKKEYNGNMLKLGEDDILVIEGIHCLNDELSHSLPLESKFKIYISALTQLNVDEHNRVATTDGRLVRRMVRDARTRGASAKRTLSMWASVRRGEEKNIFPFQEEADVMFNSALTYELAVLKPYAESLLFSIGEDEPEYQEAKRLLKFLGYFMPCTTENIPINSIIREFVGGGCFKV